MILCDLLEMLCVRRFHMQNTDRPLKLGASAAREANGSIWQLKARTVLHCTALRSIARPIGCVGGGGSGVGQMGQHSSGPSGSQRGEAGASVVVVPRQQPKPQARVQISVISGGTRGKPEKRAHLLSGWCARVAPQIPEGDPIGYGVDGESALVLLWGSRCIGVSTVAGGSVGRWVARTASLEDAAIVAQFHCTGFQLGHRHQLLSTSALYPAPGRWFSLCPRISAPATRSDFGFEFRSETSDWGAAGLGSCNRAMGLKIAQRDWNLSDLSREVGPIDTLEVQAETDKWTEEGEKEKLEKLVLLRLFN